MKDSVITLENGINYYIVEEIELEGRHFILGSIFNVADQSIDENNVLVQEVIEDEDGYRTESIEDQEIAEEVTMDLLAKMRESNNEGVEA